MTIQSTSISLTSRYDLNSNYNSIPKSFHTKSYGKDLVGGKEADEN